MKIFYLLFALFPFTLVYCQSGYLGSKNSIAVEYNAGPTLDVKTKLTKEDEVMYTRRIINSSYKIVIGRVINKNISVNASYRYTLANVDTEFSTYKPSTSFNSQGFSIFKSPKMKMHSGEIELRFYRKGSLAPTGKYVGLSLNFGQAKMVNDNELSYGIRDDIKSDGILSKTYDAFVLGEGKIDVNQSISFFQLRGVYGRSYPLNDFLMLNVGMSFALLSSYNNELGFVTRFSFLNNEGSYYDEDSWYQDTMARTAKKYTRLMGHLGVSVHF